MRELASTYPQWTFVFTRSADCDLRDGRAVIDYVRSIRPEAIIHLAAVSGGVAFSRKYPATLLRDNVLMGINVLEAARLHGVRKVVLTLSNGMYPVDAPLPLKEESIHDGPAHESNYSYAYAKRLLEPAIRAYRAEFGLEAIGLVVNAIYGPYDKFDEQSATFIRALIQRFYAQKDDSDRIVVWGDGSALRELTFGPDLARAFLWCLEHYSSEKILNVGSTEERSIKEIAWMIADELGIDRRRVVFDATKPGGVHRRPTDNSTFVALSNFRYTPVRQGIAATLAWYARHMAATVQ